MDEAKISLKNQITFTISCTILFSIVYNGSAWYTSTLTDVPSFVFNFEKFIPFLPFTIFPYLTSGIFFISIFFFCKKKAQGITLCKRLVFIIIIAGISYLLYPLKFSLQRPETNHTLFQFLFGFLTKVDSPFNQSPSLHVAFACVFWTVFRTFKTKWSTFFAIWLLMLGLSTLTTYQHHVIDILTGAILAQTSFVIFPVKQGTFQLRNFHLANYYFLGGWSLILFSLLLNEFFNPIYLILLWPSLILFLVGYHYQKNHVHFLKDEFGTIPVYKKIFYFPYVLIYWCLWKFLRKHKKAIEILPNMYISSKLDKVEIQNFNFNENTVVYDFSAELEEHAMIKKKSQYFATPLLDIGAFDVNKIKSIVLEISEKHEQLPKNGKILIHCTMGFTRSAFIGILVVKKILSLPLNEAILKIKDKHKNAVIHSYLQDFLKTLDI